jgi:hypothetical protein
MLLALAMWVVSSVGSSYTTGTVMCVRCLFTFRAR